MNQINLQNRLAVSNGTVKNGQNNAMQPALQTTENGQAEKKSPLNRIGLFAILAVGVDAAASFLKAKMEKAAAVASQVGAAILKSKKAVSAAATAILGVIQPKLQKIAENRPAKAKARLASALRFALLAAFFIASPQAMAGWAPPAQNVPEYKDNHFEKTLRISVGRRTLPIWTPYYKTYKFHSKYYPYNLKYYGRHIVGKATSTHWTGLGTRLSGGKVTYFYGGDHWQSYWKHRLPSGTMVWSPSRTHLTLANHKKMGDEVHEMPTATGKRQTNEHWNFYVYFPDTSEYITSHDITPSKFVVGFGAIDDNVHWRDDEAAGFCTSKSFTAPGHSIKIKPCIPDNMWIPIQGYLMYTYSVNHFRD